MHTCTATMQNDGTDLPVAMQMPAQGSRQHVAAGGRVLQLEDLDDFPMLGPPLPHKQRPAEAERVPVPPGVGGRTRGKTGKVLARANAGGTLELLRLAIAERAVRSGRGTAGTAGGADSSGGKRVADKSLSAQSTPAKPTGAAAERLDGAPPPGRRGRLIRHAKKARS